MEYLLEHEVEGVPFEDRCSGCSAPRHTTETNVVRIHRPNCPVAFMALGRQQTLSAD